MAWHILWLLKGQVGQAAPEAEISSHQLMVDKKLGKSQQCALGLPVFEVSLQEGGRLTYHVV